MTLTSQIPFYIHDFLNAAPIIYPICEGKIVSALELRLSHPSHIAKVASEEEHFSGVIPSVAALAQKDLMIIDSFCVSSKGPVKTVCLYSRVPLEAIQSVLLDSRSRTSHLMLKVILGLKDLKPAQFTIGSISNESIRDFRHDSVLIIGDDNIILERELSGFHKYDLGKLWFSLTGKKFVHAVTVTNDRDKARLIEGALKECLEYSSSHYEDMIQFASRRFGIEKAFCVDYLKNDILYAFDKEAKEGLEFFRFSLEKNITNNPL